LRVRAGGAREKEKKWKWIFLFVLLCLIFEDKISHVFFFVIRLYQDLCCVCVMICWGVLVVVEEFDGIGIHVDRAGRNESIQKHKILRER
jgi:hypothetical protein